MTEMLGSHEELNVGMNRLNLGQNARSESPAMAESTPASDILRMLHEHQEPPDSELLKDLPYALRGLKTTYFKWAVADEAVSLEVPRTLPFPLMSLLYQILEPAVLYKQLRATVDKKPKRPSLVRQSLKSCISDELHSYLELVGSIEGAIRRDSLTLHRCLFLLHDATLTLRLLYAIHQQSESVVGGGQILSIMYEYSQNGDQFVSELATRLLEKLSKPFFEILNQWISRGRLVDPFEEFFVKSGPEDAAWNERFTMDASLVPCYMTSKVAHQVFQTGKSLYFIRVLCEDHEWVDVRRSTRFTPVFDSHSLEQRIFEGYDEVVMHLNTLLRDNFHIGQHLQGLKDYLLLGKGDFVQLLVEESAATLDQPASSLLRHHLTSMLETAIRGSNSQFDSPEVLKSVDARMLELSHGDIGWEVFTLEYRVERPLDIVILDKMASREYLRVFNFLWRIKWASFSLYTIWKLLATGHRGKSMATQRPEWGIVRRLCHEMSHFVGELQYYINYEVVEMSWDSLKKQLDREGGLTVDETIEAHRNYLKQITHKGLLGGGGLIGELHEILKSILSFRGLADGIYNLWLTNPSGDLRHDELMRLENLASGVQELKQTFERNVDELVYKLEQADNSEMRFLAVRLDFNEFYSRQRT